jgi:hypothetical protein
MASHWGHEMTDSKLPPLSVPESLVFGADAKRHPVLGFVIEHGSGCLPIEEQARQFVQLIEHFQGKPAADALRVKVAAASRRFEIVRT